MLLTNALWGLRQPSSWIMSLEVSHSVLFCSCFMQQLLIPGRVRDYGESPRKRARLAVEGFTWGCPLMPSAADTAGADRILVAAESVMSQLAADLAPGIAVEYRSREAYLIGGWFRATICQVLKSDLASAPQDAKASGMCPTQHLVHSCAALHVSCSTAFKCA